MHSDDSQSHTESKHTYYFVSPNRRNKNTFPLHNAAGMHKDLCDSVVHDHRQTIVILHQRRGNRNINVVPWLQRILMGQGMYIMVKRLHDR